MAVVLNNQKSVADEVPGLTRPMTYQEYLDSPEEMRRYDIINGWKIYRTYGDKHLPNPTRRHQIIQGNLFVALRAYAKTNGYCRAISAPCDVLITSSPIYFRQPDILVISESRWSENPPSDDPAPLSPAPELVVEVVSPSESSVSLNNKLLDYLSVGVKEMWIVRGEEETVEVRTLEDKVKRQTSAYKQSRNAISKAFDGLQVPLEYIFSD